MKTFAKRLLAIALALITLLPVGSMTVFSSENANAGNVPLTPSRSNLAAIIDTDRYNTYITQWMKDGAIDPSARGTERISINVLDYNKDPKISTAQGIRNLTENNNFNGRQNVLLVPGVGHTAWTFNVPKAGLYTIQIEYWEH